MTSDKIITFRAGIATFDNETQMCHPLPMQGTITITPSGGDDQDNEDEDDEMGFWDFQWSTKDRTAGNNNVQQPIQLILIPGETQWVHVKSCQEGRVFALVFSSNEKYFFWLQDKLPAGLAKDAMSEKDQHIYDKIVALLNLGDDEEDGNSNNDESSSNNDNDQQDEQNNDVIMADAAA